MVTCTRCGAEAEESPAYGKYNYCDECVEMFEEIRKNEMLIRSRHGNREFDRYPYEVTGAGIQPNQVKALAKGLDVAEKRGVRAVFHYQKTRLWWLVDEYLEAHPGIAEDVEKERRGFLSRLLG